MYKFKVGDEGKTRSGRAYKIVHIEEGAREPICVRLIDNNGKPYLSTRWADGRYASVNGPSDLLPPKQYIYLNIHTNGALFAYNAEERARRCVDHNCTYAHIAVQVELPEGVTIP